MRFGPKCEEGFLPVFSVGSMEEARELLTIACPRNLSGEYVAQELATEQTLENLYSFGDRLKTLHDKYLVGRSCKCQELISK